MNCIETGIRQYRIKAFIGPKAPVTPNGDATAFVQRSKTMSARCVPPFKYQICQL